MRYLLTLVLLNIQIFASLSEIVSFKADFIQTVTDEKNKTFKYEGNIVASKPKLAMWKYISPVEKDVYINSNFVTIIEPEIEQVILRKIESEFDFFKMIKNAKKISDNEYLAKYNNSEFTIEMKNKLIESISYKDEFDNAVKILFSNQAQNIEIDTKVFKPIINPDFDIIRD